MSEFAGDSVGAFYYIAVQVDSGANRHDCERVRGYADSVLESGPPTSFGPGSTQWRVVQICATIARDRIYFRDLR